MKTYDPGSHFLSISGIRITGFAKGTYIKVGRSTDTWSSDAGGDGEVCRIRSRDERGKMTITLMASSESNDRLSLLAQSDENNGDGVGGMALRDGNGTTKVNGSECWIVKPADVEESVDLPDREWNFEIANLDMFVGGNK